MFPAILVSVACLAGEPGAAPNVGSQSKTSDLTAYEETRAKMGRGPDAHVRMAIWCEAHGLNSERLKHLAIAVLTDPAHATARGLLGLVAFRGQWQSPEAICEKLEADETASAALAEYNGRRARMGNSADSHWKIAVWCEQQGLKPEATAHLTMVTQLDPRREAAWKRLGYRKQGGAGPPRNSSPPRRPRRKLRRRPTSAGRRCWPSCGAGWTTSRSRPAQPRPWRVSRIRARAVGLGEPSQPARRPINRSPCRSWGRSIRPARRGRWRSWPSRASRPRCGARRPRHSAAATSERSRPSWSSSCATRSSIPTRSSTTISLHPVGWDGIGSLGFLFVQGPLYDVLRTYPLAETRLLRDPSGFVPTAPLSGYEARVMRQRQRQSSDLAAIIGQMLSESEGSVRDAKLHVRQVNQLNAQIIRVLAATTGKNLGDDREVWRKWWAEEQGYTYDPPPPRPRQDLTLSDSKPTFASEVRLDCFAAGTPVHTLTGLRPIELIEVGDQVLTQDPRSGALSYQPVVATVHSQPEKVLEHQPESGSDQGDGHRSVLEGRTRLGDGARPQAGRPSSLGGRSLRGKDRGGRWCRAGVQPQGDAGPELLCRPAGHAGPRQQPGRACAATVRRRARARLNHSVEAVAVVQ